MEKLSNEELRVNDVVQITETGPEGWMGCFVQVSEVKTWGIQGWVQIPMQEGQAYIRLKWDQFEFVGEAVMGLGKSKEI